LGSRGQQPGALCLSAGYRILRRIPRLPGAVIENLVNRFGNLQNVLKATIEELDDVEGIGEIRARAIKTACVAFRTRLCLRDICNIFAKNKRKICHIYYIYSK